MHHKYAGGRISHLAGGSNGSKLVFPGLFVLFALLEESLWDFDVLHDQRMSFLVSLVGPAIFTVALGTLYETQECEHFLGRSRFRRENVRRGWGHYEYRSCVL